MKHLTKILTAALAILLVAVAMATAAAYFGLECDIYMGTEDIKKQADMLREEQDAVIRIVREAMEGVAQLSVPLISEAGVGENWLVAH